MEEELAELQDRIPTRRRAQGACDDPEHRCGREHGDTWSGADRLMYMWIRGYSNGKMIRAINAEIREMEETLAQVIAEYEPYLRRLPNYRRSLYIDLIMLHDQRFSEDYVFDFLARDSILEKIMGFKMLDVDVPTYRQMGYEMPTNSQLDYFNAPEVIQHGSASTVQTCPTEEMQ